MRRLIVNADDFGFTHDVNAGIVEAHDRGILTAATLMANGAAFEDAVALARRYPSLDVGCHIVLAQGASVAFPGRDLPATIPALLGAIALRRIDLYGEASAQVRRIVDAGLEPTHIDTHKHTHLLPPVLEAVARVAEQFGIRWVRRPLDFPIHARPVPFSVRFATRCAAALRYQDRLARHGCRVTDHFAGFELTGRFHTAELVAVIHSLPEGTTEFMCHPGRCGGELRLARTRLKESRERELQALTADETRAALAEAGVELVGYRAL